MYIFGHISLISSLNEKYFRKIVQKIQTLISFFDILLTVQHLNIFILILTNLMH